MRICPQTKLEIFLFLFTLLAACGFFGLIGYALAQDTEANLAACMKKHSKATCFAAVYP